MPLEMSSSTDGKTARLSLEENLIDLLRPRFATQSINCCKTGRSVWSSPLREA